MKNKTIKTILLITLIAILVLLVVSIIFSCLGVVVGGRCIQYVGDYSEYYLYKKDYKPFRLLTFGGAIGKQYKIWFLPGQKRKALEKIKEDVNVILSNAVENNSNIFRNYEISEDFKKIYLYYYKDTDPPSGLNLSKTVGARVELYHKFIHGSGKTELSSIINYVEVE